MNSASVSASQDAGRGAESTLTGRVLSRTEKNGYTAFWSSGENIANIDFIKYMNEKVVRGFEAMLSWLEECVKIEERLKLMAEGKKSSPLV